MSIGRQAAVALADLRAKVQVASRQLSAEGLKAGGDGDKKSMKFSAVAKVR